MTLCTAWVRKSGNTKELIVATDSRLRSCGGFDGCPKIFPLPRKDAIICFQGDTMLAYPLMIHIQRSIDLNFGLVTRAIDFTDGRHAFLDMINKMMGYVFEQIPEEKNNPPVSFILAGYSWKREIFLSGVLSLIEIRKSLDTIRHRPL